jgi:hypothetical protein
VQQIEVGPLQNHEYPVEKGLQAGQRVIVEGLQNAVPGARVNVQQAKSVEPAGGPGASEHGETRSTGRQ